MFEIGNHLKVFYLLIVTFSFLRYSYQYHIIRKVTLAEITTLHSLSRAVPLVVTRCITCLPFYERSTYSHLSVICCLSVFFCYIIRYFQRPCLYVIVHVNLYMFNLIPRNNLFHCKDRGSFMCYRHEKSVEK